MVHLGTQYVAIFIDVPAKHQTDIETSSAAGRGIWRFEFQDVDLKFVEHYRRLVLVFIDRTCDVLSVNFQFLCNTGVAQYSSSPITYRL